MRRLTRRHETAVEISDEPGACARKPRVRFRSEPSATLLGVMMNIPTLLTLALVLAYPIVYAAYLSFHKVALAELRRGIFPFFAVGNYLRDLSGPPFI